MSGRVLILDDDVAVGETIGFVAEAANMEARSVTSPADFFRIIEEWEPTHIILDLIMPEMDGVEIMRHLANRGSEARIIILSGVGSRVLDAARRAASEKGLHIIGVLPKPISPKDLQAFLGSGDTNPARRETPRSQGASRRPDVTERDLRRAIAERQFEVVYQPKIHCASGTVAGFEALVRWQHPDLGVIMPDVFIPVAESLGLIDEITEQILEQAMSWMSESPAADSLSVSVNLSARTLMDAGFADRLAGRCAAAKINPDRLILELTETTAMEDPLLALDLVTRLRMKGFHISIDDVGTGYSSMAQLARLPFSEMKVDKSFVINASASRESRAIIASIVELGHKLDLRVVAEGVEDEQTLAFLHDTGCDFAQGFYIARPMSSDRIADWMSRH